MAGTLVVLGGWGFRRSRPGARGPRARLPRDDISPRHRWLDAPSVHTIRGDRLDPASLAPLREHHWDLVADTWSGAPRAVRDSARALSGHAARYAYISSESVYRPPPSRGADESAPTVAADPDAEATAYPEDKRGGEIAVELAFGDRALLARAGTILGPYEDVGRLTWWLGRMARGGEVLCPGPPDLPLQYVDARDLAGFVLDAAAAGRWGPFNVVSRRGHATMGSLLQACHAVAGAADATLTWVTPEAIAAAGIEPWTELPDLAALRSRVRRHARRRRRARPRRRPALPPGGRHRRRYVALALGTAHAAAAARGLHARRPRARSRARGPAGVVGGLSLGGRHRVAGAGVVVVVAAVDSGHRVTGAEPPQPRHRATPTAAEQGDRWADR